MYKGTPKRKLKYKELLKALLEVEEQKGLLEYLFAGVVRAVGKEVVLTKAELATLTGVPISVTYDKEAEAFRIILKEGGNES